VEGGLHPPYPRTAFITAINGGVFCGIFIKYGSFFLNLSNEKSNLNSPLEYLGGNSMSELISVAF
jgi:hypothetical protein